MPSACWASPLGHCSDKISREHWVSRSFFTAPSVSVKGMPWCKLEEKTIGIDSAVARVLCQHHNSMLSPLDTEAGKFTQVLRAHQRLYEQRSRTGVADGYRRFAINAKLLERWMLKTIINVHIDGKLVIGQGPGIQGQPTLALVKAAFGIDSPGGGFGMYVASHINMAINFAETLAIAPLILAGGNEIHGALLNVYGLFFYFNATEHQAIPTGAVEVLGIDWNKCQFAKRFRTMRAVLPNGARSHEIRFNWW
jgi:hypothetical protein